MNKRTDLFYGFIVGILVSVFGAFLFIKLFTEYEFIPGVAITKTNGNLGKLITLGTVLNLVAFFLMLRLKKELMARGVVLATIILAIITIIL